MKRTGSKSVGPKQANKRAGGLWQRRCHHFCGACTQPKAPAHALTLVWAGLLEEAPPCRAIEVLADVGLSGVLALAVSEGLEHSSARHAPSNVIKVGNPGARAGLREILLRAVRMPAFGLA